MKILKTFALFIFSIVCFYSHHHAFSTHNNIADMQESEMALEHFLRRSNINMSDEQFYHTLNSGDLNLSGYGLTSLDESIGHIPILRTINLTGNHLMGLPNSIKPINRPLGLIIENRYESIIHSRFASCGRILGPNSLYMTNVYNLPR